MHININKKEVIFNINSYAKVKLTDLGISVLEHKNKELQITFPSIKTEIKIDENGYYKDQFYRIMNDFGSYLIIGNELPFETEIIFCDD